MTDSNPLLDVRGLPRFTSIRPEYVEPAVDQVLADNRAAIERLTRDVSDCRWDNFMQPLEDMGERLNRVWSPVSHLNAVMNSDELRKAYNACLPKLSAYSTEVAQNESLYRGFKQIAARADFAALTPAQRKIVENALRDFRLSGAELHDAAKARFKEIEQALTTLTAKYEENVLDATNGWTLHVTDETRLHGIPGTALVAAREAAEERKLPGFVFTLHFPSYFPLISYCDDRALRREMYEAYVTRASETGPNAGRWDNGELMQRILLLRHEKARLLGFADYAALSLATKMASSTGEVLAFLRDLGARSRPAAQRELDELRAFAAREHGVTALEAWDISYYSEKLREALYDFNEEELRPYFPEDQVLRGLFSVVQQLYGLKVEEIKEFERWHPTVRFFEIRDSAGEMRGRFYLDLYARAGKRGGAWMDDCIGRRRTTGGIQTPVAYLVCNFQAPSGGKPALFTHDEVTTLFHEFGHGLHHLLTRVEHLGVSGINGVKWDAVELPSQFMENWCWEKRALDDLARHFETGAPLPDDLYKKMIAAKNFQSGMQMVRQLEFSIFDMRLHAGFDPARDSIQALLDNVRREVSVVIPPAFNRFQNGFTHIFSGGYSAGYYSYKWAEVLSADAFAKFEEQGVFNRETGESFLHEILEQGGVYEPMEMYVKFRGRKPTIDALLRHSGLAA